MLGVIIVAYKNPQRVIDFINNQLIHLLPQHVTVVVNNNSTMEECQYIADRCNGIACTSSELVDKHTLYIVHSPENLGFAKGNNMGVDFLNRNNPCEYILFSNDDIIIMTDTDITPMMKKLEDDKIIGAIGPDIIGLDGRHQSPHYRLVSPYRQIGWHIFPFLRKRTKVPSYNSASLATTLREGECYWVSGAFFLMRTETFLDVGGFDPDTFLYSEEPILAERLKRIGKRMYFYPNISIIHIEGGSSKKTIGDKRIKQFIIESNCIYYYKYLKTPKAIVALYKYLANK